MEKSPGAFLLSVERLDKRARWVFWTFTFARAQSVPDACRMWSKASKMLVRKLGFRGVRVFEMHEWHGVHVHVVTDRVYSIEKVKAICERYRFGRIGCDWVRTHGRTSFYLVKYLTKAAREECMKRRRLWQCVGMDGCRVRDVEINSSTAEAHRAVRPWIVAMQRSHAWSRGVAWGMQAVAARVVEWWRRVEPERDLVQEWMLLPFTAAQKVTDKKTVDEIMSLLTGRAAFV